MKLEYQDAPQKGLSFELLLFITLASPLELLALHLFISRFNTTIAWIFSISRFNTTIAWILSISSVVSVASLWLLWFVLQRREKAIKTPNLEQ